MAIINAEETVFCLSDVYQTEKINEMFKTVNNQKHLAISFH